MDCDMFVYWTANSGCFIRYCRYIGLGNPMINDRALTAKLATEAELMPAIKQFAERFGNNGKLPSVAVITKNGSAYFGTRPVKTEKIIPHTGF